jgi:SAM-dependent MidA family methyltransferase
MQQTAKIIQHPLKSLFFDALNQAGGKLSVATFMEIILQNPQHGYYHHVPCIGRQGDFVTAPSLCSLFGTILGAWFVHQWQQLGRPQAIQLIELGPGSGLMLRDILQVIQQEPDLLHAIKLKCLETNPFFIDQVKAAVSPYSIQVYSQFEEILQESIPAFIVANEFLDALPIHQFVYEGSHWFERKVCWHEGLSFQADLDSPLESFLASQDVTYFPPIDERTGQDAVVPGTVLEICTQAYQIIAQIARHLINYGGAALLIDYGTIRPGFGDTLQAIYRHQQIPLDQLLETGGDVSAHVDFYRLVHSLHLQPGCERLKVLLTTQRHFLQDNGIMHCALKHKPFLSRAELVQLDQALHRLLSPTQMGQLFKVLTLSSGVIT